MYKLVGLAVSVIVALGALFSFSPRQLPDFAPTEVKPDRLLINGVAQAGQRLLAVGEQGLILSSSDGGKQWEQLVPPKPARGSTLTAISFADDKLGLAVGHDGWILRTADGGVHWEEAGFAEAREPLLGVAAGAEVQLAVGAFGQLLRSEDQGRTWVRQEVKAAGERHLNAVAMAGGGRAIVAGEAGTLLKSEDGGRSWTLLSGIYEGSFFGVTALSADEWLVYGMRGHVFRSRDFGKSWEAARVPFPVSLFGGTQLADGSVVLVGQGGAILVSTDRGASFEVARAGGVQSLASAVAVAGGLVVGGESGVRIENLVAKN